MPLRFVCAVQIWHTVTLIYSTFSFMMLAGMLILCSIIQAM